MPDFRSNVRCFSGFQGGGRVSPKAYGAKGDGVADDTTAIRAAHDYCVSLPNGGDVILDGSFRITDTLTWNGKVSLVGVGNCSIGMDHPTKDWFSITGSITTPTRFENFYLASAQANSGTVFNCATTVGSTPQRILIRNVMSNLNPDAGLVQGTIVYAGVSNQTVTVQNCTLNVAAAVPSCTVTGGSRLVVSDSAFSPPGTSNTMMIEIRAASGASAQIDNCAFIGRPGGGVGGTFIYTAGGGRCVVTNCHFAGDPGTGTLWYAHGWAAGATVMSKNHTYNQNAYPINFGSPPPTLTDRYSNIELLPSYRVTSIGTSHSVFSGYQTAELGVNGASFTATMPAKLFIGQRLRLAIQNNNGAAWKPLFSGSGAPSNLSVASLGNLSGVGSFGIYEFVVSDIFSGTPDWFLIVPGQL